MVESQPGENPLTETALGRSEQNVRDVDGYRLKDAQERTPAAESSSSRALIMHLARLASP